MAAYNKGKDGNYQFEHFFDQELPPLAYDGFGYAYTNIAHSSKGAYMTLPLSDNVYDVATEKYTNLGLLKEKQFGGDIFSRKMSFHNIEVSNDYIYLIYYDLPKKLAFYSRFDRKDNNKEEKRFRLALYIEPIYR
ncbi:MAG: hypothetical protein QM642_11630 [Edaphocola sp.]